MARWRSGLPAAGPHRGRQSGLRKRLRITLWRTGFICQPGVAPKARGSNRRPLKKCSWPRMKSARSRSSSAYTLITSVRICGVCRACQTVTRRDKHGAQSLRPDGTGRASARRRRAHSPTGLLDGYHPMAHDPGSSASNRGKGDSPAMIANYHRPRRADKMVPLNVVENWILSSVSRVAIVRPHDMRLRLYLDGRISL